MPVELVPRTALTQENERDLSAAELDERLELEGIGGDEQLEDVGLGDRVDELHGPGGHVPGRLPCHAGQRRARKLPG
jgi:hypothetical protein